MSRGMMIVGIAALVGLLFFFLPWFGMSGVLTLSGWTIAKTAGGYPHLFLMPLAMIGCLVLVFLVFQHQLKIRTAAIIAIGLAIISLVALVILLAQGTGGTPTMYGLWVTIIANLAIIGGGILDLLGR